MRAEKRAQLRSDSLDVEYVDIEYRPEMLPYINHWNTFIVAWLGIKIRQPLE